MKGEAFFRSSRRASVSGGKEKILPLRKKSSTLGKKEGAYRLIESNQRVNTGLYWGRKKGH